MSTLGKQVSYLANGGKAQGYLSEATSGKGIGIIVIQEWWGLVDHIQNVCDRFARAGFTALAPDMYDGVTTSSPDEAGKLFMALNIDDAEKKLKGAVDYLLTHPSVVSAKVGSIGFCMGGQLSLYAASKNPSIGACVNFYGIHPAVKPDFSGLNAPVLGIFAEKDGMVTGEAIMSLERNMQQAGKTLSYHIYPNTTHAFFNDTRSEVYDAKAALDAWNKSISFFKAHLS